MKHVLLAATAVIATAGVAAAEVSFSGFARFGIGYEEDRSGSVPNFNTAGTSIGTTTVDTDDAILISRFRLNIDANAETDGGVEFSARVRLQADENSDNGEAETAGLNGARFSVTYGGLRVDVGNVAGAFDNLPNYFGNEPGLEEFIGQYSAVDYSFLEYSSTGTGANAVYFQYAIGDFSFGASYDQGTVAVNGAPRSGDTWDVSATYTLNNITAALAYGEADLIGGGTESLTALTLGADFGTLNVTLIVADDDVATASENGTAYGASLAYDVGTATTITAAYGDGSADNDLQQYGIGVIHDLGGGVSLRGGVGRSTPGQGSGQTQADFGVWFNF